GASGVGPEDLQCQRGHALDLGESNLGIYRPPDLHACTAGRADQINDLCGGRRRFDGHPLHSLPCAVIALIASSSPSLLTSSPISTVTTAASRRPRRVRK